MKLKNKISGEIKEFALFDGNELQGGATLESLMKEWEDAPEEPKEHWTIGHDGAIFKLSEWENQKDHEEIGNYFETKEEAEKAIEKLKAWKRLKDKGFRFDGYDVANRAGDNVICVQVYFKAGNYDREEIEDDLYFLFGGEE